MEISINDLSKILSEKGIEFVEELKRRWGSIIGDTVEDSLNSGTNAETVKIYEDIQKTNEELTHGKYINEESFDISATNLWSVLNEVPEINNSEAYEIAFDINSENRQKSQILSIAAATEGEQTNASINILDTQKDISELSFSSDGEYTSNTNNSTDLAYGIENNKNLVATIVGGGISKLASLIPDTGSQFFSTLKSILDVVSQGTQSYIDGIAETNFGSKMEQSWYGSENSFLNYFSKSGNTLKVKVLNSTPLDSGENMKNLYGSLMLAVPYQFGNLSDPDNRTLINSFVKDGRFLTLTPGLPKFNGGYYTRGIRDEKLTGNEILSYLLKNGIDEEFTKRDKRYYTFQAKYAEYYSYLEAMLTPIWLKLGLGTEGSNTFNIFSFFNIKNASDGIDPNSTGSYKQLKNKYKSLGFFINAMSAVSESINSQPTSFGSTLAGNINSNADQYQQINYLTGMGTGTIASGIKRSLGIAYTAKEQIGGTLSSIFSSTISKVSSGNGIGKLVGLVSGLVADTARFSATGDVSSIIQSFATTNGMHVAYPELWSDSSYSKNMNFNISFTSPYGDPLSIFQYVYVPFCALLCFALPRQADSNGFVSPFFVRADIPGLITSDLALITDVTWTKGGESGMLWTKDGLPRSISCSFTLTDLYPYLAMTKRYSYLTANPSYTVFLDNMTGLCAINKETDDPLNTYWERMISRVSGDAKAEGTGEKLWNKFSEEKQKSDKQLYGNTTRSAISKTLSSNSVPWLRRT